MPTGVETNLQVSFWWYDHRWLLVGAVSLLLAASLTSRLWGSYARKLARRNSQLFPGPNQVRTGRTRLDWLVSGVTRFLANTPLVAGTLIAAVLLVAALVPQALAPYGPQDRFPFLRTIGDELTVPPFAPDSRSLMGSDQDGRDILSRIIHGTRGTISICVAVTILRFLIGGVLGGIAGWRRGCRRAPGPRYQRGFWLHPQPPLRLHFHHRHRSSAGVRRFRLGAGPDRLGGADQFGGRGCQTDSQ